MSDADLLKQFQAVLVSLVGVRKAVLDVKVQVAALAGAEAAHAEQAAGRDRAAMQLLSDTQMGVLVAQRSGGG